MILAGTILTGSIGTALAQSSQPAPALQPAETTKAGVDAWGQGDYMKAVSIWRPLAFAGEPDAQFNMGQAYKLGRGVPMDLPVAAEWFRKAAVQGHVRAEDNYGLLLFQQNKREEAMPYIRKSADRSEPRAQYLLATALYNGDLAPRDWVRAYALMTQAAKAGLPQATTSLAMMDQYIPEAQRKQGLALATQMALSSRPLVLAAAEPPAPPVKTGRPAPSAIRTTDLPPSQPAAVKPVKPAKPAPVSAPAAKPASKPAVAHEGDWLIQLGAFSEDARARALWSSLSGKVKTLGAYQPAYIKSGAVTRLQAGPLASEAEAGKLCAAVRAAGADCMVRHK